MLLRRRREVVSAWVCLPWRVKASMLLCRRRDVAAGPVIVARSIAFAVFIIVACERSAKAQWAYTSTSLTSASTLRAFPFSSFSPLVRCNASCARSQTSSRQISRSASAPASPSGVRAASARAASLPSSIRARLFVAVIPALGLRIDRFGAVSYHIPAVNSPSILDRIWSRDGPTPRPTPTSRVSVSAPVKLIVDDGLLLCSLVRLVLLIQTCKCCAAQTGCCYRHTLANPRLTT